MSLSPGTASHPGISTCVKEKENTGIALEMPDQVRERLGKEEFHTYWKHLRAGTRAIPSCRRWGEEPQQKNVLKGRKLTADNPKTALRDKQRPKQTANHIAVADM